MKQPLRKRAGAATRLLLACESCCLFRCFGNGDRAPRLEVALHVEPPQQRADGERVTAVIPLKPPNAKSSMLEDLERWRPLELPWLSGAVVRIGAEVGVETPIHRFIAAVLKPHVNGVAARK